MPTCQGVLKWIWQSISHRQKSCCYVTIGVLRNNQETLCAKLLSVHTLLVGTCWNVELFLAENSPLKIYAETGSSGLWQWWSFWKNKTNTQQGIFPSHHKFCISWRSKPIFQSYLRYSRDRGFATSYFFLFHTRQMRHKIQLATRKIITALSQAALKKF